MVFKFLVGEASTLLVRTRDEVHTVKKDAESGYTVTNTHGDGELWTDLDQMIACSMLKLDRVLEVMDDQVLWRK